MDWTDYARLYVRAAAYASLLVINIIFLTMVYNGRTDVIVPFNEYGEFWLEFVAFGLAGILLVGLAVDYLFREFR